MKEEVRIAIETLKMIQPNDLYIRQQMNKAIAIIERALTETTLEIVKRKREEYRKLIHEANAFDRNWFPRLIDTLDQIIAEVEGKR